MSTQGIEIEIAFTPPVPFTDEWLDAIYISLEKNIAIVSSDMFVNEDEGTIKFLFGIDNFLDGDDFTESVAREAIEKALQDAAGPNQQPEKSDVSSSGVLVFA